jgi:hypothetical protein
MNARARYLGFSSYAGERAAKLNPDFTFVQQRAITKGQSRAQAIGTARRLVGSGFETPKKEPKGTHRGTERGRKMGELIRALYDEGLYDNSDPDAADDLYYE